jgi:hypothetical protein
MGISEYMQYISFNKFDPPVKNQRLSYLKACRLQHVSLHREGLLTKSFLWNVTSTLLPIKWARCPWKSRKNHDFGLNDFQRDRISQLADVLRKSSCRMLAAEIERYLVNDMIREKPCIAWSWGSRYRGHAFVAHRHMGKWVGFLQAIWENGNDIQMAAFVDRRRIATAYWQRIREQRVTKSTNDALQTALTYFRTLKVDQIFSFLRTKWW